MNIACGLHQSGVSSSTVLSSRCRLRGRNLNLVGDSRVCYRSCYLNRKNGGFRTSLSGNLFKFGVFSRTSVPLRCQPNDSVAFVNGSVEITGSSSGECENSVDSDDLSNGLVEEEDGHQSEDLKELLQKALKELDVARLNSTMFEEKAQRISESAIALKDKAENAWGNVTATVSAIQEIIGEEGITKEAVQKATMALSMAEARLQLAMEAMASRKDEAELEGGGGDELLSAQEEIKECKVSLEIFEAELRRVQTKKEELQKEVDRLSEVTEKAQLDALKAEEDVANIMLLAEQAVAFELEATQCVNDAELALQKAEKAVLSIDSTDQQVPIGNEEYSVVDEVSVGDGDDVAITTGKSGDVLISSSLLISEVDGQSGEESTKLSDEMHDQENRKIGSDKEDEVEADKLKKKKQDVQQKEFAKDSPLSAPKALLKKSSRFFSASFFSFNEDEEFTPALLFYGLIASAKKQAPKLVLGLLLLGTGAVFLNNRADKNSQLLQQPEMIPTIEEVTSTAKPVVREIRRLPRRLKKLIAQLPHQEINEEEASLFDMLWLLLASVIFVPIFQKIPGGSPVLGYLAAGILIGPYGFSIIRHVHGTKAIAEFGVVFLLFNIGLELSVERLSSMKKYVFGLGSAQVLVTAIVVGWVAHVVARLPGPAAIVVGNGLALSSTAVVLQVLQERGESTSRHGRATFSVLLFQDLAVVVLLILIPLISPNSSKGGVTF